MARQRKPLFPPGWPDNKGFSFDEGMERDKQALAVFLFLGLAAAATFVTVMTVRLLIG